MSTRGAAAEREEPRDGRTDRRRAGGVCVHSPLACMGSWAVSCRWFLKAKPRGNEARQYTYVQRPQSFDDVFSLGDYGNPSEFSHEMIGNFTQPMPEIGAVSLNLSFRSPALLTNRRRLFIRPRRRREVTFQSSPRSSGILASLSKRT